MTTTCERALPWISLALDDELSEFERALLERHLAGCDACSAVRVEIEGVTRLIRAAPPVASRSGLTIPAPPGRRRGLAGRAVTVALAAAALGAGVFVFGERSAPVQSSALAFASQGERLRFVHAEHVRTEPLGDARATGAPPAPSFAARALM